MSDDLDDGRLFDVPNDVLEEHPILPAQETAEAKQARGRLQKVLDTLV